jgi:chromosome segregation ATPase
MKSGQHSSPAELRSKGNGRASASRQAGYNDAGTVLAAQFKRLVTQMTQMQSELDHVKRAWERMGTSREDVHERIERARADLDVQFKRIAMMQAEIDRLKANEVALLAEIDRLKTKNPPVGANHADPTTPKV